MDTLHVMTGDGRGFDELLRALRGDFGAHLLSLNLCGLSVWDYPAVHPAMEMLTELLAQPGSLPRFQYQFNLSKMSSFILFLKDLLSTSLKIDYERLESENLIELMREELSRSQVRARSLLGYVCVWLREHMSVRVSIAHANTAW